MKLFVPLIYSHSFQEWRKGQGVKLHTLTYSEYVSMLRAVADASKALVEKEKTS